MQATLGNGRVQRLVLQPATLGPEVAREDAGAATATATKHYSVNSEVILSEGAEAKVAQIADAYYAKRKKDIVVTSGTRTAASQADAMYIKLEAGDDVVKLYRGSSAVKAIKKAYDAGKAASKSRDEIVAAMTEVVAGQISAGVYISAHLRAGAVDIRSRDMSDADKAAFRKIARSVAKQVLLETKPPHWHLQL